MQKENLFFFSFPSVSNLSKAPFRQYFPFPLSLRLVFPFPLSFPLSSPCKNRAKVFAPSLPTPKNMKIFDREKLSK